MTISSQAFLGRNRNKVRARANTLQRQIATWLQGFGESLIADAVRQMRSAGDPSAATNLRVQKQLTGKEKQLFDILSRFGLRQLQDSVAEDAGKKVIIPRTIESDYLSRKEVQVQRLADNIRSEFRSNLANAVAEWLQETPQPSIGEIARRMRTQFFTRDADKLEPIKGGRGSRDIGTRSEIIARTEVADARLEGKLVGMEIAGVEFKEWLAYSDGKSGDRHHEVMNGQVVEVRKDFVLPSRGPGFPSIKMSRPHDPSAPIKEKANCRCSLAPSKGPATQ